MYLREDYLSKDVLKVCEILTNNGFQAFIVGGSIRDLLLRQKPNDWDIATNALPSEVTNIFKGVAKVIPTGIKHGTVTIIQNESNIEVTTFRTEGKYEDGRRPIEVTFINNIEGDLARRDLTINAIAYDPIKNKLIDPFQGISDIKRKILKLVGNPDDRLQEDGLRLIRIFRFVSELGFEIEKKTYKSIPNNLAIFDKIAKERIYTEFQKLMSGSYWFNSLLLVKKSGLLFHLVPEFTLLESGPKLKDIDINRLEFTFKILAHLESRSSLRVRYAVLLHQISAIRSESQKLFPIYRENHILKILRILKFPNKQIDEISQILKIHKVKLPYQTLKLDEEIKDYKIRKFLYKIRPEYLLEYLDFYKAKEKALHEKLQLTDELENDIREKTIRQKPVELNDLAINGEDIITFFKLNKKNASMREFIGLCLSIIRERVEIDLHLNKKQNIEHILNDINKIVYQCKARVDKRIRIVSTDHIRKLYRNNLPEYKSWENKHTYQLALWLILCLLRKTRNSVIIFDATNLNLPSHPRYRESIGYKFKRYKPLFIHAQATEEETKKNLDSRKKEKPSILTSDADLKIYNQYKEKIESFSRSLSVPKNCEMITVSSRSSNFQELIMQIAYKVNQSNHRLIIMSGNVLSGKSYIAHALQLQLQNEDVDVLA
ncbi:MAG: CCA tRNA nucleotidyltransferase [Candidatus Hodarchaeota archaeon]